MKITRKELIELNACKSQVELFDETFPGGMDITPANVRLAEEAGLTVCWYLANGHTKNVAAMIEAGADVHADYDYALRNAARNGRAKTVRLLLDHGADVHAIYDYALRHAADNCHTKTVLLLIESGADATKI